MQIDKLRKASITGSLPLDTRSIHESHHIRIERLDSTACFELL